MRKLQLWVCALTALFVGGSAQAITVTAGDVTAGGTSDTVLGVQFTAGGGGNLSVFADPVGTDTLGVSSGFEVDELDVSGDTLTLTFENPTGVMIDRIVIGRLFLTGEHGDAIDEAGMVTASGTSCSGGCGFDADGGWDGTGGSSFSSTSDFGGYGEFTIEDPFDGAVVTSFTLQAVSLGADLGSRDSDFSLLAVDFTPEPLPEIPEPGTAGLLGLGMLGLGLRRRAAWSRNPATRR